MIQELFACILRFEYWKKNNDAFPNLGTSVSHWNCLLFNKGPREDTEL